MKPDPETESPNEEQKLAQAHFERTYQVFKECAFSGGEPVLCQLHDAFGTFDSPHHNCLGCNFADSTELILNFLGTYHMQRNIQFAFSTFMVLAYLLVERMDTVLNIVELNKGYRGRHFGVLLSIRKWANFLKHPKAFILTHHPRFTYVGAPDCREQVASADVVIDRDFVDRYYSNDEKDRELYRVLENKERVLVVFPSAVDTAEKLCAAMADCVSLIRDNKVYREVLEGRSTFRDYWMDAPRT